MGFRLINGCLSRIRHRCPHPGTASCFTVRWRSLARTGLPDWYRFEVSGIHARRVVADENTPDRGRGPERGRRRMGIGMAAGVSLKVSYVGGAPAIRVTPSELNVGIGWQPVGHDVHERRDPARELDPK